MRRHSAFTLAADTHAVHVVRRAVAATRATLLALATLAFTAVGTWTPPSAAANVPEPVRYELNIEGQPLSRALQEFAKQSGVQIIFFSKVTDGYDAPPLSGKFTAATAMSRLLSGLPLTFRELNAKTIQVQAKNDAGESADVSSEELQSDSGAIRLVQAQGQASAQSTTPSDAQNEAQNANSRGEKLEEIVVTAQKRSQRSIEVPISISAMSGEDLERAGIDTILDLSHSTPGLFVSDLGGGYMRYYIRGIGNVYGTAATSLVGVYLDEADITGNNANQLDMRTQDIDRVEVLKGPQGTLYGAGASGGVVRFITNDPKLDRFTASGEVDMYATRGGDASQSISTVLNIPVVENVLGLRVVGAFSDLGGWVDQPALGRKDINNQRLREVRIKGLWKPTEDLSVKMMAYLHRNEGDGVASSTDENYDYVPSFDPTQRTPFISDFDVVNMTVNYDFSRVSLVSSSTYMQNESNLWLSQKYAVAPAPAPLFEALSRNDPGYAQVFNQEVRLSSRGDGRLNWTLGGFYKNISYNRMLRLFLAQGGVQLATLNIFADENSKSSSAFGNLSYALTDRAEIGAGVRYFQEDLHSFNGVTRRTGEFDSVDPRLYFSYGFTPDLRVYVSAADGFRSGGFNVINGTLSTFSPEKVRSYEAGVKASLLDRRLSASAAAFYSNYKDILMFKLAANNVGAVNNGGDALVKGIDVSFDWQATEKLLFQASGNYTDATIESLLPGVVTVREGDPVDYSTDYAATLAGTYSFSWGANVPGFMRVDYSRIGPAHTTDRSIGVPVLYESEVNDFVGARIGAQWSRFSVELYGTNLLDENRLQDPLGSFGFGARPRPRTVGLQIGGRFD